jgi:SAM-dependent methyltransferase
MNERDADQVRTAVRERYAAAARNVETSCCAPSEAAEGLIGGTLYGSDEIGVLPEAALAASLGCGNPTLLADLHDGEVVLDLGSGGGIDVLLSARRVAPSGKAYGLDMTPEMLELARRNQADAKVTNAEFLEGTMEAIPLPDRSVDVVISNCVVNLSPDKRAVLGEVFRVLRPRGRLAISDIVLRRRLPEPIRHVMGLWTGCVSGALIDTEYQDLLVQSGFVDAQIEPTQVFDRDDLVRIAGDLSSVGEIPDSFDVDAALDDLGGAVMSAFVRARKPAT